MTSQVWVTLPARNGCRLVSLEEKNMISSNELRAGHTIEYRGGAWQVIESMHVKPGKGSAFVQTKLRNLETSEVLSVNFRAGERVSRAEIERIKTTFTYKESSNYVLLNVETAESIEAEPHLFGRKIDLLKEGLEDIVVTLHRKRIVHIELPISVDLEVRDTPPNERGNTNSGGGKQAQLETGATVTVPFHVKTGDTVRVDTRTREYLTRLTD